MTTSSSPTARALLFGAALGFLAGGAAAVGLLRAGVGPAHAESGAADRSADARPAEPAGEDSAGEDSAAEDSAAEDSAAEDSAAEEAAVELAELRQELDAERGRRAELEQELHDLQVEFDLESRKRVDREMEFLDFTEAVASFDLDSPRMKFTKELLSDAPGAVEPEPPEPDPAAVERERRSHEMARDLRALMRVEWIQGMDLLELGELSDEGWIGPVVFRLLDDRGHLSGSLSAQRLHLEGSTSGRVVTIVLEDGEERTGGESLPFREGLRRIALPGVDPRPWIEALPELFDEEAAVTKDDGLWDLERVRVELNRLLAEDATGDVFRMRHLGGVEGGVMRDVYFEVRDENGAVLRRLFADRCAIERRERGLVVQLEDGVIVRGDSRAPFLDGRYRVFLPRARTEAWERARLPGLVESESAPGVPAEADPEAPSPGDSVGMSSGRR